MAREVSGVLVRGRVPLCTCTGTWRYKKDPTTNVRCIASLQRYDGVLLQTLERMINKADSRIENYHVYIHNLACNLNLRLARNRPHCLTMPHSMQQNISRRARQRDCAPCLRHRCHVPFADYALPPLCLANSLTALMSGRFTTQPISTWGWRQVLEWL